MPCTDSDHFQLAKANAASQAVPRSKSIRPFVIMRRPPGSSVPALSSRLAIGPEVANKLPYPGTTLKSNKRFASKDLGSLDPVLEVHNPSMAVPDALPPPHAADPDG